MTWLVIGSRGQLGTDLMELLPVPGCHPLYINKWILEVLVVAIVHHEYIHISGPTGSCKSSLLEALHLVPENFNSLLEPTDVTRGRMRRELAKKIAQSQAQVQPTEDDLAIAFMRACQAQNAVDDAAQQTGDYRPKRFNG